MSVPLGEVRVLRPGSLEEALRMLRDEEDVLPIAGCTDVYVAFEFDLLRVGRLLDLRGLPGLDRIEVSHATLRLGALATYTQLRRSPEVRERLPILAEAAATVGGIQIQNRGTLGGNLANASPAGDTLPVLAAVDAVLVLRSASGERRVPVTGFFTGYRETVLRPDELIVAVEVPAVAGEQWFRKVGTRAAQAISKVVMAAVRDGDRTRIALGSVAPTVVRLPRTEAALAAGASLPEARGILREEIAPIDDIRSTAAYRTRVAANLLGEWWEG